jgi:hypothetical protein
MKTVNIYKAQTIGQQMTVEPLVINISEEFPDFKSIDEHDALFEKEALMLADGLLSTLPGGTIDRLVAELLKRKATSFVVPLFGRENGSEKRYREATLSDEERRGIAKVLIEELDKMTK